ncbi:MAG TPA: signal peptidase I [Clostridia bacterium]|nr:signal peptidase I [Clostridia bacterium]
MIQSPQTDFLTMTSGNRDHVEGTDLFSGIEEDSAKHTTIESYFGADPGRSTGGGDTPKKSLARRIAGFLTTLAICLILVLLITQFVVQRNTVIGRSMVPTLEDRDEIFVEKISRLFATGLKRGDIVTADTVKNATGDEIIIIKRVIGLPGERVTIREGYVFIDDERLEEPYLVEGILTAEHALKHADVRLGPEEYYLLGDNRRDSRDSRDIGPVTRSEIEGKLLVRFYPFDKIGVPR